MFKDFSFLGKFYSSVIYTRKYRLEEAMVLIYNGADQGDQLFFFKNSTSNKLGKTDLTTQKTTDFATTSRNLKKVHLKQ